MIGRAKMQSPAVSIGMPAYNSGKTISAAIESILCQTFRDFELIISDNASTDDTRDLCRQYARGDSRIRILEQPCNIGANANYNAVAKSARSKYFKWASTHDLLHQDFLRRCVDVLETEPECVICMTRTRLFTDNPAVGEEYEEVARPCGDNAIRRFREVFEKLRLNNAMNGVVRRVALESVGYMPTVIGADAHMVAELALHGRIVELPETMFFRRMTRETATALQSPAGRFRHVYGDRAWRGLFANWRRCAISTRSVLRAPLGVRDRALGLGYVSRFWIWQWRGLIGDIGEAAAFPFRHSKSDTEMVP